MFGTTPKFKFQGESEPLETDCTTLAKDPYDPPGPPENVKLKDWDKRWVKLTWEKPKDDGGARITHYIIEKKEVEYSSSWIKAAVTETDDCEYKVTDLAENSKYRYDGNFLCCNSDTKVFDCPMTLST